VLETSH